MKKCQFVHWNLCWVMLAKLNSLFTFNLYQCFAMIKGSELLNHEFHCQHSMHKQFAIVQLMHFVPNLINNPGYIVHMHTAHASSEARVQPIIASWKLTWKHISLHKSLKCTTNSCSINQFVCFHYYWAKCLLCVAD